MGAIAEAPTKGAAYGRSDWTNVAGPRSRALVSSPWTGSRSATDVAAARDAASRPDDQGRNVQPGGVPHNGRRVASRIPAQARPSAAGPAVGTASGRVRAAGKFLFQGDRKLYVRGVTYGTFAPNDDGVPYPAADVVERDFARMASAGLNAVRVYTVPPRWLLDLAAVYGLVVLVGLPWEQHVAFLAERTRRRDIERRVREGVRACAGHPALLGYAVGNEIPSGIVRWHGRVRVERFLRGLVGAVRDEDDALVTYVNYPSTEYLEVPCVDFACFNVYLERRDRLAAYLARLQNLAGDLPLVMAE